MQPDTSQLYLYIRVIDYELQGIPHFILFLILVKPLENQSFCFNRSLDFFFLVCIIIIIIIPKKGIILICIYLICCRLCQQT